MNNAERIQLFQHATSEVTHLLQENPGFPPFVSIYNQLQFLIQLASGAPVDPAGLMHINIGQLTVREVEQRDDHTANVLYSVSGEVDKIKAVYGLPVD